MALRLRVLSSVVFALYILALSTTGTVAHPTAKRETLQKDAKVLILGGGVSGVIAARTLYSHGYDDFMIVDARHELGGRMQNHVFGEAKRQVSIELGANWIQGTQTGDGPINPILELARKHDVKAQYNDLFGSITTYDYTGPVDYLDVFNETVDAFDRLVAAGGARIANQQVDTSARTGFSLVGSKPKSHHAQTSEYYLFDWEDATAPEESSWMMSTQNDNASFNADVGGFSEDNLLCVDQRGFKTLIQQEAATFLKPSQVMLDALVKNITYDTDGVSVTLADERMLRTDYAIVTFSVGVLQNDDVVFAPPLPDWKQEAIQSMTMATYTKVFLQFPQKFWFDTEMALYADKERGRYPIWQSLDHAGFLPDSGVLFVTVTSDFSMRIEALPDDEVKSEVMSVLRQMYPNVSIPEPTDFYFPRWHSDPLFRGSYTSWPPSFVKEHHDNVRANVGERLWFAGEGTSFKYYGFLHGAYFEGLKAGNELVDCFEKGACSSRPVHTSVRRSIT